MSVELSACLTRQLDTSWRLALFHLDGLTTDECLWRPAAAGLHVYQNEAGMWLAEWPDRESYDIGPPSIAWLTWHIGYWWSMVLDHSFGSRTVSHDRITWPGTAAGVRDWLSGLHAQWRSSLEQLDERELIVTHRTHWPFAGRPFSDVAAWVNVELAKNAAEIGYARFLYAVRTTR